MTEHVNLSQFKSKCTDLNSRVGINSVEIRMGPYECGFCNETTVIFEAYESLLHDLIWDLVYGGSPTDSTFDQLLMSVNYGTAERGEHKFLMEAPPPDVKKIPVDELIGTTQIILKAKYNGQEFLTLGWPVIVNSPAVNIDELLELPLSTPVQRKLNLTRKIRMDQCSVKAQEIDWEDGKDVEMENSQS